MATMGRPVVRPNPLAIRALADPALSGRPVILVHLADENGLAECAGLPFMLTRDHPEIPRVLCSGCTRALRARRLRMAVPLPTR